MARRRRWDTVDIERWAAEAYDYIRNACEGKQFRAYLNVSDICDHLGISRPSPWNHVRTTLQRRYPVCYKHRKGWTLMMTPGEKYDLSVLQAKIAQGHLRGSAIQAEAVALFGVPGEKLRLKLQEYNVDPDNLANAMEELDGLLPQMVVALLRGQE